MENITDTKLRVSSSCSNLTEALGKFAVPAFGNPGHRGEVHSSHEGISSFLYLKYSLGQSEHLLSVLSVRTSDQTGPDTSFLHHCLLGDLSSSSWRLTCSVLNTQIRFAHSKKMKDKKVILLSPTSDLCLLYSIITNRLQLSQVPLGLCPTFPDGWSLFPTSQHGTHLHSALP